MLGCLSGSQAEVAGLRYGDVLLSVGGLPTPDWETFIAAHSEMSSGQSSMVVEIFRDGAIVEVTYQIERASRRSAPEIAAELVSSGMFGSR